MGIFLTILNTFWSAFACGSDSKNLGSFVGFGNHSALFAVIISPIFSSIHKLLPSL